MIFLQSVLSIITTSVFFGVITMKLSMSKREKLVQYNLMMEELEYDLRHKAASVLQSLWRARNRLREEARLVEMSKQNDVANESEVITESEINLQTPAIRLTVPTNNYGESSSPAIISTDQDLDPDSTELCPSNYHARRVTLTTPSTQGRHSTNSGGNNTSKLNLQPTTSTKSFVRRLSIAIPMAIQRSFMRRESAIPEENNSQTRIKIEESQVVHQSEVIRAVNNFAQVRNQHIFRRSREDVEGTHRSFQKLEDAVGDLSGETNDLTRRLDGLSEKVEKMERNLDKILELLERKG